MKFSIILIIGVLKLIHGNCFERLLIDFVTFFRVIFRNILEKTSDFWNFFRDIGLKYQVSGRNYDDIGYVFIILIIPDSRIEYWLNEI